MRLRVKGLNLLFDGYLPRDSINGDEYRGFFFEAKPVIDYAFKVERPAFIRAWWFDWEVIDRVFNEKALGERPKLGKFYPINYLLSDAGLDIAEYVQTLGWQVRLAMYSIDRLEYIVLVLFDAEGSILEEDEEYNLLTLDAREDLPLDDAPPVIEIPGIPLREWVGV